MLFVDSSDKAARFICLCDAFNVPLLFLSDVPGFMVGSVVEKQGIIRHGAKLITAVAEATVPKICVVVRKAYGAGLYAMAGPGFDPDATLALPYCEDRCHGSRGGGERRVRQQDRRDRGPGRARRRSSRPSGRPTSEDIDVVRLAAELVVDDIVLPADLRGQLVRRFAAARTKDRSFSRRRHGVTPV